MTIKAGDWVTVNNTSVFKVLSNHGTGVIAHDASGIKTARYIDVKEITSVLKMSADKP